MAWAVAGQMDVLIPTSSGLSAARVSGRRATERKKVLLGSGRNQSAAPELWPCTPVQTQEPFLIHGSLNPNALRDCSLTPFKPRSDPEEGRAGIWLLSVEGLVTHQGSEIQAVKSARPPGLSDPPPA